MLVLLIAYGSSEYWRATSLNRLSGLTMRWNILVSLLVLLTAVTPTALRVAREQLSRYQPLEAAAEVTTETMATARSAIAPAETRCQQCDLAAADLSGQDLSRKNFRGANLAGPTSPVPS
jgi:uncharacterized protein YjbI with pentapeptide repeats